MSTHESPLPTPAVAGGDDVSAHRGARLAPSRWSALLCHALVGGHDFYRLLGVPRDASPSDIESAHRHRMNALASMRWKAYALAKARRLDMGLATLGDAASRRAYDEHLALRGPDRLPFPM